MEEKKKSKKKKRDEQLLVVRPYKRREKQVINLKAEKHRGLGNSSTHNMDGILIRIKLFELFINDIEHIGLEEKYFSLLDLLLVFVSRTYSRS